MDDPDCDSTWEDDAEEAGDEEDEDAGRDDAGDEDAGELRAARPGAHQSRTPRPRNWRAVQDMCRYRRHYPGLVEQDCNGDMPNLSFYKNKIRFLPNGCLIEEFLQQWRSRYSLLEDNHSYIQWLFPLREAGVNWHAKPLTLREVEAFKSSKEVRERLVRAYELMLDFYGIQLQDRDTGAVCRAHNYQKRFQNLNWHSHNNLRITRILKSLGELGLEQYQAPLARFFLEETLVRRELPAVRQSALDYFVFAVRCRHQRRELLRFAWEHFRPRCQFVWGPHDKLRRFRPLAAPPPRAGPGQAEGGQSPEAGAQGQTCGPDRTGAGDREAESPPGTSTLEREPEAEAGDRGEDQPEPEPPSPKETKKRKLEANRQERTPEEPGPWGASDVEKIAQNLEGCALSQGGQEPGDTQQPCPGPPGARPAETRKRRKVDGATGGPQAPAPAAPSAPQGCPGAGAEAEEPEGPEESERPEGPEEGAQGCLSESSGQGTARDAEQDRAGAEEPAEP